MSGFRTELFPSTSSCVLTSAFKLYLCTFFHVAALIAWLFSIGNVKWRAR